METQQKFYKKILRFDEYSDLEIKELESKLFNYYNDVTDYSAFNKISNHFIHWDIINNDIKKIKKKLSVLEIGAGRSGYFQYLKKEKIKDRVFLTSQDITEQNLKFLKKNSDEALISDITKNKIKKKYDIIFCSHVLEHVARPKELMDELFSLLNDKGAIYIFCPRYDFLGYHTPSSRHFNFLDKIFLIINLLRYKILRIFRKKPNFIIQNDLAAFHKKAFFTDCDAIHWVSKLDIKYWAKSKKLNIKWFNLGEGIKFGKDYIVKKYLTISVKLYKNNK